MPSAEQEAYAAAEAAPRDADGRVDMDVFQAEYERGLAERHVRLLSEARSLFRVMDDWGAIKDADDWQAMVRRAAEDIENGGFLLERLGAERYLDPTLMAVLLVLRRRLIDEHEATGAAELMLVDMTVLAYYHTLRVNSWIGNFALLIEGEFFRKESLSAKFQDRYGRGSHQIAGLKVEEYVERFGEQLMPLLDRCNRMLIRNLKALQTRRQPPSVGVSIGSAGQVNVGQAQVNTADVQEEKGRR